MAERRPRSVYGAGTEPDPRFSLANERTLLAWCRTAIGLMAGGVALEALPVALDERVSRLTAALLILMGGAASAHAWLSWRRVERAIRLQQPLPAPVAALVLTVGLTVAGALLLVALAAA